MTKKKFLAISSIIFLTVTVFLTADLVRERQIYQKQAQTSPYYHGQVGTFFFHWYRCPDNPDPDPHAAGANACDVSANKILNIAPGMKRDDPYPEGGYYHSGNLNWYKRQFTDMVYTGINFAFVVDLYQTSQITMMGQAITQLNLPLKLGFFWDPPAENPGIFDLLKTTDIEKLYKDYIFPFYSALPREQWVLQNNRPIILTVYTEQEAHLEKARELFLYIKDKFRSDFGVEPWLVVDASWWFNSDLNGVADAKYTWGGTIDVRNDSVNGFKVTNLGPGVDMRKTPWGGLTAPYIDRRGGDRFRELLSKVPNDSNLLMIETWNELFENTGIARSITYKGKNGEDLPQTFYMDILRNYLGLTNLVRNAEVKFLSVPKKVNPGETFAVSVEVKNKGLTYWSKNDEYALGTQDPTDNQIWGTGRIYLAANEVIFPNSTKVFTFNLKAPDTVGVQKLSLKMVQDKVAWFGDDVVGKATADINIGVAPTPIPADTEAPLCSPSDTRPVTVNPSTIVVGQTTNLTATFTDNVSVSRMVMYVNSATNGGTSGSWGTICDLTGLSGRSVTRTCSWTSQAGGTYAGVGTHKVIANAVDSAGNVALTANGRDCSGTGTVTVSVPTLALFRGATCVSNTIPNSVIAGSTFPVSVTMKNTGTMTWTAGGANPYRLGSQDPTDNLKWGTGRIDMSGNVAPGASHTFTFNETAPTTVGTYSNLWKMLQEGVTWFGQACGRNTTVVSGLGDPSNLAVKCLKTQAEITWKSGTNATYYSLRLDDLSNGWSGTCSWPDVCPDTPNTWYHFNFISGHTYKWWMHSRNKTGNWGKAVAGPNFTCK